MYYDDKGNTLSLEQMGALAADYLKEQGVSAGSGSSSSASRTTTLGGGANSDLDAFYKSLGISSDGTAASGTGGTGKKAAITTNVDLSVPSIPDYKPLEEYKPMETAPEADRAATDTSAADRALDLTEQTLAGLREKNQAWLEGRISGDVADQLRAQAALGARAGGIGSRSQAARNLRARDFGLTSASIQEKGMANEAGYVGLQQNLAQLREQRSQFQQDLFERQHQFSSEFDRMNAAAREQSRQFGTQTGEASRQFGASMAESLMRAQLAQKELMLKQEAFNADANRQLIALISEVTMQMTQQQLSAASGDISDTKITTTFNDLQAQLERLLENSNK